jgi:hypothetical protein
MRRLAKALCLLAALAAAPVAHAFDADGVQLGGSELDVKQHFPSAYCKPLEWKTAAADRRCDDPNISLGGVPARITFYLEKDAIQAFHLRFDMKYLKKVVAYLETDYGKPLGEKTEVFSERNKPDRKVYKLRWEKGKDQAVLTGQLDKGQGLLEVWRGDFEDQLYRVR